jgi:uncharacterized LabA/DUF88 family protein
MSIYVYVDAFNFYYGLTKGTPYRWCNLGKLAQLLLPNDSVDVIKVFAAYSKNFPNNPAASQRQKTYLRALSTIPNLEMYTSKFSPAERYFPLSDGLPNKTEMVKVRFSKEKGSDVKLASQLLIDGFEDAYDMAVIFTNDSDLTMPIQIARYRLGKRIGVILTTRPPDSSRPGSKELMKYANFTKLVTDEMLAASQFPDRFTDAKGSRIEKPDTW